MIIVSILSFLFKKRMTFGEIFSGRPDETAGELVIKVLKSITWYLLISLAYHSIQQPINIDTVGIDASWPFDSIWYGIDGACDLIRSACQYRMNIKWQ